MNLQHLFMTPITYVQIALLLFFSVFISVLVREYLRSRKEISDLSDLPLTDLPESKENRR